MLINVISFVCQIVCNLFSERAQRAKLGEYYSVISRICTNQLDIIILILLLSFILFTSSFVLINKKVLKIPVRLVTWPEASQPKRVYLISRICTNQLDIIILILLLSFILFTFSFVLINKKVLKIPVRLVTWPEASQPKRVYLISRICTNQLDIIILILLLSFILFYSFFFLINKKTLK